MSLALVIGPAQSVLVCADDASASRRKSVDLLKRIEPGRDSVEGKWRFDGKDLVAPTVAYGRIEIPFDPPRDYDFAFVVDGWRAVYVGLVVNERPVMLSLDPPQAFPKSGLEKVSGQLANKNVTTHEGRVLEAGKPNTVRCTVRPRSVDVTCNGQLIIAWRGDPSDLSWDEPNWAMPNSKRLYLGCWQECVYRISRLELTPLDVLEDPSMSETGEPPLAGAIEAPGDGAGAPTLAGPATTAQVVQFVEPSIVVVDVTLENGTSQGSGFLVDTRGSFVTNYHVIEGAKSVRVMFRDKSTAAVPGYLAIMPGKDLAVLRCDTTDRPLQPLRLAAAKPAQGESVLTFGAPLGFGATVSDGIESALRRGNDVSEVMKGGSNTDVYSRSMGYDFDAEWLQITAPISPGNSGGPLVNMQGEVLGLNTWCLQSGQNLNFAISGEHIRTLLSWANGVRPFAELPTPRPGHGLASRGDAERTFAFWGELGQINRWPHSRINSTKRPPAPANAAKSKSYYAKMASYYKSLAETVAKSSKKIDSLDRSKVDGELVGLAAVDGACLEELADMFRSFASDAEIEKKVTIYDAGKLSAKSYGKYGESDVSIGYDILRLELAARYNRPFPNILGDAYKGQVASKTDGDDHDGVDPAMEKKAADKLKLAKSLIESKPDRAKEMMAKIVAEFKGTKAAQDAQRLIDEHDAK
ncbi:MAG TPA: trypsin-like peptidase domain-containing protein [Pirellulales bacterium]|nr:trypsin-like peptidase domain-containing protein [Pirellulales bacterium]